jgi:hypothetical protein
LDGHQVKADMQGIIFHRMLALFQTLSRKWSMNNRLHVGTFTSSIASTSDAPLALALPKLSIAVPSFGTVWVARLLACCMSKQGQHCEQEAWTQRTCEHNIGINTIVPAVLYLAWSTVAQYLLPTCIVDTHFLSCQYVKGNQLVDTIAGCSDHRWQGNAGSTLLMNRDAALQMYRLSMRCDFSMTLQLIGVHGNSMLC